MTSGATAATTGHGDRLRAWMANHRRVCTETLFALMKNWVMSMMTWLVLGIAMALPVLLYLVLVNIAAVGGGLEGKPRISVYLKRDVNESRIDRFMHVLSEDRAIESFVFISPESALAEFQARSGFGDVLNSLDRNPLPAVIEVIPRATEPGALKLHITSLEEHPAVDLVVVDLAWIERLFALVALGQRVVLALTLILALGVLLAVGNTIRLAIENRRGEIEVMKLVGGTDSFVRRPFLYLGFWYGIGGALVAWMLVQLSLMFLSEPVQLIAQSYRDDFSLLGPNLTDTIVILMSGSLLGILGAGLAVSKHLHTMETAAL